MILASASLARRAGASILSRQDDRLEPKSLIGWRKAELSRLAHPSRSAKDRRFLGTGTSRYSRFPPEKVIT
jgi:hypothetical protein